MPKEFVIYDAFVQWRGVKLTFPDSTNRTCLCTDSSVTPSTKVHIYYDKSENKDTLSLVPCAIDKTCTRQTSWLAAHIRFNLEFNHMCCSALEVVIILISHIKGSDGETALKVTPRNCWSWQDKAKYCTLYLHSYYWNYTLQNVVIISLEVPLRGLWGLDSCT